MQQKAYVCGNTNAWSITMSAKSRSLFSTVGRAFAGFGESLAEARYLNELYNTPESVFRARGTTRDAMVRAALKRQ